MSARRDGGDPFGFLDRADGPIVRGPRGSAPLVPEDVVDGRWRIKTRIGAGAFGIVFEVESVDAPGEYAALKILPAGPDADTRWTTRFHQEAEVTAALDHPNIVRTLGHGRLADGGRYLAMELLAGETLAERLRSPGGLPWPELATIAEELGAALAATHAAGVLHRDVKPANVFLEDARHAETPGHPARVKLIDFGLCKGPAAVTASRDRVGTAAYMAPEVVARGSQATRRESDVYGMALTLHEAITGRPAFAEPELPRLLARICHGPGPEPPSRARADTPEEVDNWLAAALAREPQDRPADAAAFGRSLAAAIQRIHI